MRESYVRFVFYTIWGILNLESYKIALILIIPMLIGLLGGMYLSKKINERTMKYIIVLMLLISGISLIVKSILKI